MRIENGTAVFDCPHCGVRACQHHQIYRASGHEITRRVPAAKNPDRLVSARGHIEHRIYRCVGCNRETYVLTETWGPVLEGGGSAGTLHISPTEIAGRGMAVFHQFPVFSPTRHPSIPSDVAAAAREAELCLSVRAFSAVGVMARRAVDALCRDKGASGKVLYQRLESLRDRHTITPDLWEWAEDLRVAGRAGAHPEWEDLSEDSARYVVDFLREILRYVYVNPHERRSRRLKEDAKKKPTP